MSCASLLGVPVFLYLAYKNVYWKNKAMNVCLSLAIVSGFVFCLFFAKHFNNRKEALGGSVSSLIAAIVFTSAYAILKN